MTAKKKAEPEGEIAGGKADPPAPTPPANPTTDIGGLAALQARADVDAARGFKGPEKEN